MLHTLLFKYMYYYNYDSRPKIKHESWQRTTFKLTPHIRLPALLGCHFQSLEPCLVIIILWQGRMMHLRPETLIQVAEARQEITKTSYEHPQMDVSKNRGTPKSSMFNRVFHYKPSILGYPYLWKHLKSLEKKNHEHQIREKKHAYHVVCFCFPCFFLPTKNQVC